MAKKTKKASGNDLTMTMKLFNGLTYEDQQKLVDQSKHFADIKATLVARFIENN